MDDYDAEIEEDIDNIINQLKNTNNSIKKIKEEQPELSPDDVDAFILKHAAQVIFDSSSVISGLTDIVSTGGTANEIIAFSELIKSFTSAVDILSKRKIADNKNKTQKEIKQMDIDSKSDSSGSEENTLKLELSREEVFKFITKREAVKNIIDV